MHEFPFQTVLVTGGTGTFGTAFAQYLRATYPEVHLRIFSRDEHKQDTLRAQLGTDHVSYLLGDVRTLERLRLACRGVELVVHAAALKIVPSGEYNPGEFVDTNVLGSMQVMRAALDANVAHTIVLSSDKAVLPLNLYGATKMLAERLLTHANSYSWPGGPRFNVVRYGNILGSRGSVLAHFQAQVRDGQAVAVTHPAMTRFWMTIAEAVRLVAFVACWAWRGEVWVPELPAFAVADLVRAVYRAARQPCPPTIPVSGRREGEKLHEQLLTAEEQRVAAYRAPRRGMPGLYIVPPTSVSWADRVPERRGEALQLEAKDPQQPYVSDTWPWRLEVAELVARLQAMKEGG